LKLKDLSTESSLEESVFTIDAEGLDTRKVNQVIRETIRRGNNRIVLQNVIGQRYLASGVEGDVKLEIFGTPGNDLGAFMDGPQIEVYGNGQDCVGNTMSGGDLVIHGDVGDITGMSMRGGRIFIQGDCGYRTGVHLKGHQGSEPKIVVGGTSQDYLGEYMAGGTILVLGLGIKNPVHLADFGGTGMHGGTIYVRGEFRGVGREVEITEVDEEDNLIIKNLVEEYSRIFKCEVDDVLNSRFTKLIPINRRPFGKLYTY
jgi:glutamate synthase domain-containing protein 3